MTGVQGGGVPIYYWESITNLKLNRSVYAWQDESIELEISDTFPIVRTELQEIVTYFKEHQIIVVNKNEGNQFSKQINKNFFDNQVKTLVIISLNDDIGEFIGCIVFTMINDYRQWRDDELWALQELVKGINVYLNKEKIFNRLDSILSPLLMLVMRSEEHTSKLQ